MQLERSIALLFGIGVLMTSRAARAAELTCPSSATLEALVSCIRGQMPGGDSGVFVAPSAAQMDAWRSAVRAMLRGTCSAALPPALSPFMQRRILRDGESGRRYCALLEIADRNGDRIVDRGVGTFIVDAAAERELSHQAAHPLADVGTELEAVTLFKETRSRSFLMAGAHRDASFAASNCQSASTSSDVAHDVANVFHASQLELASHYGSTPWWTIQWHGMAAGTCASVDVHLSHGVDAAPTDADRILALRRNLLVYRPAWRVGVPGSQLCSRNATTNVQGRFLNGVPAGRVCGSAAGRASGRFVHIEQDPGFRDPDSWIAAVMDTWP
ncbi:hypothetical protein SOCE26_054880 [Sorangium cellulosum]|uniref:Secreted protein n=1 Tax=Sorangium cellulosum TaxID=56 RepID=A0A2L0EXK3_SORCE|nr:hypothetical protein [Sorangium cellulosum]AUX44028.1 hypothetical protein SOCE26_054880 [Sorangium cellulosum]